METLTQLQQEYVDFVTSLYREGILDNQFMDFQKMIDPKETEFMKETVNLFFEVVDQHLRNLAIELAEEEIDYPKINLIVIQFKDTCSSFGTHRVVNCCDAFSTCYVADNIEGCMKCVPRIKDEYFLVKSRFQTLLTLEQRIRAAGGTVPDTDFPLRKMKRMLNPKCHRVYGH